MRFGMKVNGRLEPLPATLGLSQRDATYEVHIDTQGIPDEGAAASQLMTLEQQVPDLRILHIDVDKQNGSIIVQFTDAGPGQFGLETVFAFLPQILLLSGIVAIAITMFWIVPALQGIPNYVWYIVAGGVVLLVGAWLTGAMKLPMAGTTASQLVQSKQALKVADRTAEEKERVTERHEKQVARAEEKVASQRQRVYELINQQEQAVREYEQCTVKGAKTPGELDRQIAQCLRKQEQVGNMTQKLNLEIDAFNTMLGIAGKTEKTIAERAKVADKLTAARSRVERLQRRGVDVSDLQKIVIPED